MMKIDIEKIKILFFGYLYFPKEKNDNQEKAPYDYDNLLKNKEIEKLELIEQSNGFNKKANFYYGKNEFKIEMEIVNQKLNNFQRKFSNEIKELKENKNKLTIISDPKMNIYFNLSNIEFIFYKANFASIINNNETAELFIYLNKFDFEIEITRKFYDNKELKYYFPFFPDIDIENILNNLKFHDVVFSFNLEMKYLFDIILIYENKFKLIKNLSIKKINAEGEIEDNNEEEEEDYYDLYINFDIKNHDIYWHLLSLVSEHFISFFNLIVFLNKYQKELIDIIKKDEFLFIILLRDILKTKYTLSKIKIKFFNPDMFYDYIKKFLNNKLDNRQKKEYDKIKNIYTTNEIRSKYFRYNLYITPLTLEFKIPFLKTGIFFVDKFIKEFKSYDLIYFNFQLYKKISSTNIIIDIDMEKYFIYNIINKSLCLFNLNYKYLGTTFDDMKYQKVLFINEEKIKKFELKRKIFNIWDNKDIFFINDIFFNEDIAAYSCEYKSIKKFKKKDNKKNNININRGIISSSLKQKIKEGCNIHNFYSCYGIMGGFLGNFSVIDEYKYNNKNRIVINENKELSSDNKNIIRDRTLYIFNIFKYNPGILDNDTIILLNIMNSENIVKSFVNNILNLKIENIYYRVPISKLKFFLKQIKDSNKENNEFIFEIKKAFLNYHYNLIRKNILEIPNSAILNGIFDEYDIIKHTKENNYICVIIDKEKYEGIKYIKGSGIIFNVRKKYLNSNKNENNENNGDKICKIKFFDLEKCENENIYKNSNKYEAIQKIKNMRNVVIFPKKSEKLFSELDIKDISQQEFFISWNKDVFDNIKSKKDIFLYLNSEKPKKEIKEIKNPIKNIFPKHLRNKKQIFLMHDYSKEIFQKESNLLSKNKIKNNINIDYKNLTHNLINKQDLNLNELELFYLEYIPKCTLVIKNIINELKELMQIYSVNNIIDLLIGNINIQIDSKNYLKEIENINDVLVYIFNKNLEILISEFRYLQYLKINSTKYLTQYKERMYIITSIIYNICNFPKKIEIIIRKYNEIIKKLIKHEIKKSEEKLIEENNNLIIKDCFDNEINKFGVDYYLLFESNKLINDNIKKDNDINVSLTNDNNDKCKSELKYFFEDFRIIIKNEKEIKKFFIPELLLYKYLRQLNIDFI